MDDPSCRDHRRQRKGEAEKAVEHIGDEIACPVDDEAGGRRVPAVGVQEMKRRKPWWIRLCAASK